ncbi:hypothetical protein [Streptomyces sp. NPDC059816]|uniref:hypothetical protein n=1 Tax=Streptomyces sp. NPDC059816 TaxID=3346960 RepID=UPI00364FA300
MKPGVIADGDDGDTAAFRLSLEERGLCYVMGISTTTTALLSTPPGCGRGRPPVPPYLRRHRGRRAWSSDPMAVERRLLKGRTPIGC